MPFWIGPTDRGLLLLCMDQGRKPPTFPPVGFSISRGVSQATALTRPA
ncbi:hypothetical protein Salmuc_03059 [Salipiger mucosus DSM 16094]|uniref:Uncharacterized protein n=1 Tax=Salipiger mucosus DSM 16094 TaxID=1123237 RepID=S9QLD6_9RHOB|nr:hypothetical protein Salmuc_03059 [Salipiger mucosus DSM 16094]